VASGEILPDTGTGHAPSAASVKGGFLIFRHTLRRTLFSLKIIIPLVIVLIPFIVMVILACFNVLEPKPAPEYLEKFAAEEEKPGIEYSPAMTEEEKKIEEFQKEQQKFNAEVMYRKRPAYVFSNVAAIYLGIILILFSIFYGVSIVTSEVSNRTITYLFSRPVARWAVLFGRFFAVWLTVFVVTGLGITLAAFTVWEHVGADNLLRYIGVLAFSSAAYIAFFMAIGVVFRRSMIISLLWGILVEIFFRDVLALTFFGRFTLGYYLQAYYYMLGERLFGVKIPVVTDLVSYPGLWLAGIIPALLLVSAVIFTRKEYALK